MLTHPGVVESSRHRPRDLAPGRGERGDSSLQLLLTGAVLAGNPPIYGTETLSETTELRTELAPGGSILR